MSQPDSCVMPFEVHWNLCQAEALVREGKMAAADNCFAAAVAVDASPSSRIAFASSLAERERYYDALCQMTAALDQASVQGNREALGVIFHNLASVYRELGDFDLARRFQQRAILQLDDCGPDELLGLANDAWVSNRRRMAETLAATAADMDDRSRVAVDAQATHGVVSGVLDDPRAGIRSLLQSLRKHRSRQAYRLMGIDLLNLAVLFGQINRPLTEIALVEQAIHCFDRAGATVSSAKARRLREMLVRAQSLRGFDPSRN